ncbi:MAG: hypothetical protein U9Q06_01165 [Nanoarchaeota archaeon]|nr:hypothetical protein [Nanoarchaeota archaeon]
MEQRTIYIIVHETSLNESGDSLRKMKVQKEIERIKREETYFQLDGADDSPNEIHTEMLPSNPRLKIKVCGAFYGREDFCVNQQRTALKNQRYHAVIHTKGSLICFHNHR